MGIMLDGRFLIGLVVGVAAYWGYLKWRARQS